MNLKPGVSVIIPVFAPAQKLELANRIDQLRQALESLSQQSLSPSLFEVLLIFNGEGALSKLIETNLEDFEQLNLRVFRTLEGGPGRARNLGISLASRKFMTFLDSDDLLQPRFLEVGLEHAKLNTIVLLPIINLVNGEPSSDNPLNARILGMAGNRVDLGLLSWALGFNACKVVPTDLAQKYRYNERLKSGEDVVYFANFLAEPRLVVEVPQKSSMNAYLRTVTERSVSRQEISFDFSVVQRLEVIACLHRIRVESSSETAVESLINSQFNFIRRYLDVNPSEVAKAVDKASELGIWGLPWEDLRKEKSKRVVFSYCFPPYADTSANVVAKVIRDQAELVDVFYANLERVREKDYSTRMIVDPFVVHSQEIQVEPSFADWELISLFAEKAASAAVKRAGKTGHYSSMYSRALWSGSHVAALLYKIQNPNVTWVAEFSDPLALGVSGEVRLGKLTENKVKRQICREIQKTCWEDIRYKTHFELTEVATMILAEELVFTNQNQMTVMIDRFPQEFQEFVIKKATIRHHVVPTPAMYQLIESSYSFDKDKVNLGYFGNFYGNRGLGDVLDAMASMVKESRERICLHIFTSSPASLETKLWELGLQENVLVNNYVNYLEFLNLSTRFDLLIVNDTEISGTNFEVNPFLPSKYSDYAGSGTPIWGICTSNSPLSQKPLAFRSEVGDKTGAMQVINKLASGEE